MKCSTLRRLLADGGAAALAGNREAEDHLVDCGGCYAVLEAMTEIDTLLPALEPHDVADEIVEQLLARTELREPSDAKSSAPVGLAEKMRRSLSVLATAWAELHPAKRLGEVFDRARQARLRWGIVAVPAVILIGVVSILTMRSHMLSSEAGLVSKEQYVVKQVKFKEPPGDPDGWVNHEEIEESDRPSGRLPGSGLAVDAGEAGGGEAPRQRMVREPEAGKKPEPAAIPAPMPEPVVVETEDTDAMIQEAMKRSFEGDATVTGSLIPRADLTALSPVVVQAQMPALEELGRDRNDAAPRKLDAIETSTESAAKNERNWNLFSDQVLPSLDINYPAIAEEHPDGQDEDRRQGDDEFYLETNKVETDRNGFRQEGSGLEAPDDRVGDSIDDHALSTARDFLAARERIEDLAFREARGYWANTYVPGDRTLRQLKARLDRLAGAGAAGSLHDGSRQISQPFDAPDGAALAVYLHADRSGVETRERMLVQVGLKGTARRSGMRPAMNVGLVLDLRGEVTPEAQTAMRALLQAFAAATELGDRFSLTVAGRPGGTVIAPGDLRHGTLTVAVAELFGDGASGEVLSLDQAAAEALDAVRAGDDPNAPLGSSALVVITSRRLDALTGRLAGMAHSSAVEGVPWSVVGVGAGVDLSELDAVVLAGQGNRRLLTAPGDAEALVDRELAAVGRVVARAVRLRIRLAPGVQLVDVVGSVQLDENRAQQVRASEQSIDRRLARNLGIESDRGLDEEGIQIVIPSYYADDAHVVLLDVVVPGPGPVADVTVRYKDLVHMRNGVARAHLEIGRAANAAAGPLELNVLANLLAVEVASRLDSAADAVAAGDLGLARSILAEALDLVRGVAALVDGLAQNPDLGADMEMLAGYLRALQTLSVDDPVEVRNIADSLRYAGRLKILPPPIDDTDTK